MADRTVDHVDDNSHSEDNSEDIISAPPSSAVDDSDDIFDLDGVSHLDDVSGLDAQSDAEAAGFPSAQLTIWCVSAADPAAVMRTNPSPDAGFGRKYLAQLNPRWPVATVGQFSFNRSASAGPQEFYIGGYAGLSIIHTMPAGGRKRTRRTAARVEDDSVASLLPMELPKLSFDPTHLSTLPHTWTRDIPATDVYAIITDETSTLAGMAHWRAGELKRSFCATRDKIFEDEGLPEPFEFPFWSRERCPDTPTGTQLPFRPQDMAAEAQNSWLGFEVSPEGFDIPIVAFAIDGRPERPWSQVRDTAVSRTFNPAVSNAGKATDPDSDHAIDEAYDDYSPETDSPVREWADLTLRDIAHEAGKAASKVGSQGLAAGRYARSMPQKIGDRVRSIARKYGR